MLWKDLLPCSNLIIHIPCLSMTIIFVSQSESMQKIESLVKHNYHLFPKFMFLKVCCSLATFRNTPQNGHKGNHEWKENEKSILIMVYNASGNLDSNWLNVFFNLTKDTTRSLLSDQFQNIELDSRSYFLEHQYLFLNVGHLIHWWLCIEFWNWDYD